MRPTELERWKLDGLPSDMFRHPECIRGDIEAVITAIVDHTYELEDRG